MIINVMPRKSGDYLERDDSQLSRAFRIERRNQRKHSKLIRAKGQQQTRRPKRLRSARLWKIGLKLFMPRTSTDVSYITLRTSFV